MSQDGHFVRMGLSPHNLMSSRHSLRIGTENPLYDTSITYGRRYPSGVGLVDQTDVSVPHFIGNFSVTHFIIDFSNSTPSSDVNNDTDPVSPPGVIYKKINNKQV